MSQFTDCTVTVTPHADGTVTFALGPESVTVTAQYMVDRIANFSQEVDRMQFLMGQISVRLDTMGVDLTDLAAVKTAIESGTYKY